MTIMIPVNKPDIAMRAISTKEEILSLIAAMPEMETAWIDDERQPNSSFKAALKSGKNEEWVKMIRMLYLEKEARTVIGKKLAKTDEDLLNTAEKQLNQEFAVALDISSEEVVPYIIEQISKMDIANKVNLISGKFNLLTR